MEQNSHLQIGTYRHYKGNEYEVIGIGTHTETEEAMIIYRGLYGSHEIWVRPYDMFFETVNVGGENIKRFQKID